MHDILSLSLACLVDWRIYCSPHLCIVQIWRHDLYTMGDGLLNASLLFRAAGRRGAFRPILTYFA